MNILVAINILVLFTVYATAKDCESPEDCTDSSSPKCCVFRRNPNKGKCENLSRKGKRCNSPYTVRPLYQGKYYQFCPCIEGLECREPTRNRRRDRRSERRRPGRPPVQKCEASLDSDDPSGWSPDTTTESWNEETTSNIITTTSTTNIPPFITEQATPEEEDKVITAPEQTTTTTEDSYVIVEGGAEAAQDEEQPAVVSPASTTDKELGTSTTITYDIADEAISPEEWDDDNDDIDELGTEMNNEDIDGTEPRDSIDERDPSTITDEKESIDRELEGDEEWQ